MICSDNVDVSYFDGEKINYYFEVSDITGKSDVSRTKKVIVDSTMPIVNSFDYLVNSHRVEFIINASDENLDGISYIDWNSTDQKEKKLCSRVSKGICEKIVYFSDGEHLVTIYITDRAGNVEVI